MKTTPLIFALTIILCAPLIALPSRAAELPRYLNELNVGSKLSFSNCGSRSYRCRIEMKELGVKSVELKLPLGDGEYCLVKIQDVEGHVDLDPRTVWVLTGGQSALSGIHTRFSTHTASGREVYLDFACSNRGRVSLLVIKDQLGVSIHDSIYEGKMDNQRAEEAAKARALKNLPSGRI